MIKKIPNENKKCICPVCNFECISLISHIKVHKEYKIYNKEDFNEYFPDYDGVFHIDKRKKGNHVCIFCGKRYDFSNALMLHYKNNHNDYYNELHSKDYRKCAELECPICHKKYTDIKQHVNRKHKLDWEEFCNTYNWDIKLTKNVTKEYKEKLSKNKMIFYRNTERGKQLRKEQSIKWQENNPSTDRDIISKSIYTRTMNGNIPIKNGRGILVIYDNHRFRSFNEFSFYVLCKEFKINLIYEPTEYTVRWFNSEKNVLTTYLPDFYIENFGLVELKSCIYDANEAKQKEKYKKTKEIYDAKQIKFDLYPLKEICKLLNIKITNVEKKDIIQKYINEAIENDSITVMCCSHSLLVASYFGCDFKTHKNIKIIK